MISSRTVTWAAAGGALLCLLLMAVRVYHNMSLDTPLHLATSGDEIASLYAVWRKANGLDVYADRFRIPFNATFFNWLFYESYGTVARLAQADYAWLPTVGRLFTLLGALCTGVFAYLSLVGLPDVRTPVYVRLALCYALFLAAGPLVGFWAFTVRPDVWAFAFEVLGALAFLRLYGKNRVLAILALAAAAYCAWAFKQINLYTLTGSGLFLLIRRDWRSLVLLVLLMALAWGATFAVGSDSYLRTIFYANVPLSFSLANVARNLTNFAVKSGPGLAAAGIGMVFLLSNRRTLADDRVLYACTGLAACCLSIAANAQSGASENYFFPLSYYLVLFAMAVQAAGGNDFRLPGWRNGAITAGWLSVSAAVALVLSGTLGLTDVRPMFAHLNAAKACTDPLPRPLLVTDPYLSLPWMTPGTESFVLSYVYAIERDMGKTFEAGGIGGLVASGHFATIALVGEPPERLDGASLDRYTAVPGKCPDMTVLTRR